MIKFFQNLCKMYFLVPAAIILLMIYIPFVSNVFYSNTDMLDNRVLFKKPEQFTRSFAADFEKYYNDTFAGRKKLIKKLAKIKRKLKFDDKTFIHGKEDWMFYDSGKVPDGYTLIDYFGAVHFSEAQLKEMADGIKAAEHYYKAKGIDYVIAVIPNKENLYAEYMPERLQTERVSDESRMDRAVKYLQKHTDVKIINFKDVLEKAKKELPLHIYYKRDSHWNGLGAYCAFNEVLRVLNANGYRLPIKELTDDMISYDGHYSSDLDMVENEASFGVKYRQGVETKTLIDEDNGFMRVYETPDAYSDKTMLMIRDSFGITSMPYYNKVFKKTIYVHTKYNKRKSLDELVEKYHPDIVVDHLVERYFSRFLKYNEMYGEVK